MSLQSRCNYSVVAARVLWEGEERGRGSNGEAGEAGRDEMCMQKKKKKRRGGAVRGMGEAVCAEWRSARWMLGGGAHNWKSEKIRQADGGCFVVFCIQQK